MSRISIQQTFWAQMERLGMHQEIWETANQINSPMEHTHFYLLSTPELMVLSNALRELEQLRSKMKEG